jgi:murein DD-endopeptidase MepM/ murein hydrolase activator NlpD
VKVPGRSRLGRLRLPAGAPAATPSGSAWNLEIQIHPADIRRRVRYLFLKRRHLTLVSLAALLYVGALALGVAVAPGVVSGLTNRDEYLRLAGERSQSGKRLQAVIARLSQLDQRTGALGLRLEKVFLAYGLPPVRPRRAAPRVGALTGPRSIYRAALEQGEHLHTRVVERLDALDGGLDAVSAFEGAHPDLVQTTPSIAPLRGDQFVLVSGFGPRRSPFTHELERHTGIDLAAAAGTPVRATADGTVAFAGRYPPAPPGRSEWWRLGNLVIVENGGGFVTLFGHADELAVKTGQQVKRGDRLATVGSSGWSASPHLYYEVRRKTGDGVYRPVDPLLYILDHRFANDEQLVPKARAAPPLVDFEPLPPLK